MCYSAQEIYLHLGRSSQNYNSIIQLTLQSQQTRRPSWCTSKQNSYVFSRAFFYEFISHASMQQKVNAVNYLKLGSERKINFHKCILNYWEEGQNNSDLNPQSFMQDILCSQDFRLSDMWFIQQKKFCSCLLIYALYVPGHHESCLTPTKTTQSVTDGN